MEINEVLSFFRDSLGLSQKEFCLDVMSTSYYSKIEKNNHQLSTEMLLQLLNKNNISMREFFFKLRENNQDIYVVWYKEIKSGFYENDIQKLLSLKKSIVTDSPYYLILELLIKKLTGETINQSEKNQVKELLNSVNRWTEYYILLFLLVIKILEVKDLIFLFGNFLKSIEDNSIYKIYEKDIVLSLLNMIEACLKEGAISEAKYFLTLLPQIMTDPFYLFERTMIDFYMQFIIIAQEKNIDKQLKNCYSIIDTFKKYDMLSVVKVLENLMKQYGIKK